MSAYPFRFSVISGLGCSLVLGASGLLASDLVLQKVPPLTVEQAPAYPQNLARYDLGAQVEAAPSKPIASLHLSSRSEDRNTVDAALLCHDPTIEYSLPAGKTTLLVSLSRIENVDVISFLNRGTKGNLTIATASAKLSTDSPQWRKISQQDLTTDSLKVKVGPTEAKYVRLTFDITEPGRISGLGVYSTAEVSDFTMPRDRKIAVAGKSKSLGLISYNLADLHTHARTLYISSGDDIKQANNMIDDQPATGYNFAAGDVTPMTVVDLGKPTTLRRISTIYSARPGKVSFYVLQALPSSAGEDAPKTLRLDSTAQQSLNPVGSVIDDGTGRASVDFPTTTGRYIMVKWDLAGHQDASFTVAEIAAFGGGSTSANLMAANAGGGAGNRIESDGKDLADAKDAKDIPTEGPESPAEGPPPTLPDPPPFTFVPEIVPNSP